MMLKSVERDQLDREVVEMRDMRRSRLLTCALSAVVAGILVVPATAQAVGEAGTVTDDVEMTEPVSTDSQNEADNEPITVGEGGQYTTILEALQETDTGGTESQTRAVKLVGNITNGPGFSVFEHDTLTIDLNGYTLTLTDTANISVAGNLTVMDGTADAQNPQVNEESGSVTYGALGAIVLGDSSTVSATGSGAYLKLDSGTVQSSAHGCIRVATGATFEMTGGLIDSTDGFAVEVNDEGSFKMTGGVAKATNYSAVMGDDNFGRGDTRIQIDGGYILSVSNDELVGAGVCQVMDGGILQMDSGTIRAVGKGVGVIVEYGSFRLNDGEIYGDGTSFNGQTAGHVSVDNGYGLVLYSAEAGTEINGGFISGMKAEDGTYPVPSVDIADAASTYGVSTMSLDLEPVDQGVSIKGGTYTNFNGLTLDEGYAALGHAYSARKSWITVMLAVTTPSEIQSGVGPDGVTRESQIYCGDMTYYKNCIDGDYYCDYPIIDNYLFAGWWKSEKCGLSDANDMGNGSQMQADKVTETTGKAYCKFVDKQLTHPMRQVWAGTNASSDKTEMRIITFIDSLNYSMIGYEVYNEDTLVWNAKATKVFGQLVSTVDGKPVASNPSGYIATAKAFSSINLPINNSDFNNDIRVKTYWITIDGTRVEGMPSTAEDGYWHSTVKDVARY